MGKSSRPTAGCCAQRDVARIAPQARARPIRHVAVADDLLDDGDFRDFVFANTVRLYTGANPKFFDGTAVEDACRAEVESHAMP
jgi:hypothetical protein